MLTLKHLAEIYHAHPDAAAAPQPPNMAKVVLDSKGDVEKMEEALRKGANVDAKNSVR